MVYYEIEKIMISSLVLTLVSSPFIALTFLKIFPKPKSVATSNNSNVAKKQDKKER